MSDPTPNQALLLFSLLARHGEGQQAELMPAVSKADREALANAKLIEVEKVGRGLYLKLSDAGWAWASSHLSAELPSPQRGLSDLLTRLKEHLARSGETLADFVGSKPKTRDAAATPQKALKRPSAKKTPFPSRTKRASTSTKAPKTPSPTALRKQVEAAYLSITGNRKNQSVRLSQLRAALPSLDRPTLNAVLARILAGDKKATLMRHDDPRQLDQAERDAAFNPAGEPFHVIWIAL